MNPAHSIIPKVIPIVPVARVCSDDSTFYPVTWIEDDMHSLCDAGSLITELFNPDLKRCSRTTIPARFDVTIVAVVTAADRQLNLLDCMLAKY